MRQIELLSCYLNKFRLKHKNIVSISRFFLVIISLLFLIKLSISFGKGTIRQLLDNDDFIIIMASLIGAITGGLITYFISTYTIIKTNFIKSSIINKNVSYIPLYNEFKNMLYHLISENEIILYFNKSQEYATRSSSVNFTVWHRIKKDNRYFQIPNYLKVECECVENNIIEYENSISNIKSKGSEIFMNILQEYSYTILESDQSRISEFFIDPISLIKKINSVEKCFDQHNNIYNFPSISNNHKILISDKFIEEFNRTTVISDFYFSRKKLINSLSTLINTLELIIKRITNEYESKNNIF